MTPEQIEKLYLAAKNCTQNDVLSVWRQAEALKERNEKLEKVARLVRTEIALMESVIVCDWSHSGNEIRRILTELEEP